MRLFRLFRTIHGWLGVLMLPWIVAIGFTGFYLNHPRAVLAFAGEDTLDAKALPPLPASVVVDEAYALAVVARYWPQDIATTIADGAYHGMPSYLIDTTDRQVIVAKSSGYIFAKTDYTRRTYAPDGRLVDTKYYWKRVFKEFHVRGWLGKAAGTFLADAVSFALIAFGLSGLYMWSWPRLKRLTASLRRAA
jgi:hypothetical protein